MSDYITEKQFAEQTKEIRKILTSFFIQRSGKEDLIYVDGQLMLQGDFNMAWNLDDDITPCYTETWLRCLIEEKTGGLVRMEYCYDYTWKMTADKAYETDTDNLLQAYWQVACQIIKEKLQVNSEDDDYDVIGPNDIAP